MKLILLGKNGMLGSNFLKQISSIEGDNQVFAFDHHGLDILDYSKVAEVVDSIKPDFVVNCVAYNDVNKAEGEEKDLAYKINHESLKYLSENLKKNNSKLIHFSSDYVFDGKKGDFYLESDTPNPLNEYGNSKLLGEKAILESEVEHFIVRTAWLFGPNGKNFVDKILEFSLIMPELKVVDDKFGSPTYTHDLAKFVLENFIFSNSLPAFGIFHGVNEGVFSRFDLAKKALMISKSNTSIKAIKSSEFPSKVELPDFAPLKNTKLPKLRTLEDSLFAYLSK